MSSEKPRKLGPHKPPKDDVERLENVIIGLLDVDEDELPSKEEVMAEAKAAGIDFAKWGEEIRAKARKQALENRAKEIEQEQAAYEKEATKFKSRPRQSRTREEKLEYMRALVKRAEDRQLSAHFRKFEEASDSALDTLIAGLEELIEKDED
jgi:hypothetical protein